MCVVQSLRFIGTRINNYTVGSLTRNFLQQLDNVERLLSELVYFHDQRRSYIKFIRLPAYIQCLNIASIHSRTMAECFMDSIGNRNERNRDERPVTERKFIRGRK